MAIKSILLLTNVGCKGWPYDCKLGMAFVMPFETAHDQIIRILCRPRQAVPSLNLDYLGVKMLSILCTRLSSEPFGLQTNVAKKPLYRYRSHTRPKRGKSRRFHQDVDVVGFFGQAGSGIASSSSYLFWKVQSGQNACKLCGWC